ncbi:MAG: ClpX C4-type zinc finger protein [Acidimicrobiales bacterium]
MAIQPMYCSFCRRDHDHVATLVAGPGVYICGDCVGLAKRAIEGKAIPDFAGWASMGDDGLLASLVAAKAIADRVDDAVGELVAVLRERGVTWERIGETLGVSRQAAWQRYASAT